MISRKAFIEAEGGTCRNWRWSWSYVNHQKRQVIFGAWDRHEVPEGQVILEKGWRVHKGRVQPAFSQSLEHIELINAGYELLTFPMRAEVKDDGSWRIRDFTPRLTRKVLIADRDRWLAASPGE